MRAVLVAAATVVCVLQPCVAQTINVERIFPNVPALTTGDWALGDHGTNLDGSGGVDAQVQTVVDGHASYDIVDLATGATVAALHWDDLSHLFPEQADPPFPYVMGFADLDDCGHREVVMYGGRGHVVVVDPRTLEAKLDLTPTQGVQYFVMAIGDLTADGLDDLLIYRTSTTGSAIMYGPKPSPITAVAEGSPSVGMALRISPNPSSRAVTIALAPGEIGASVRIFDVGGRLVRELAAPGGTPTITWDGRDNNNRPLAAGVYFCEGASASGMRTGRRLVRIN